MDDVDHVVVVVAVVGTDTLLLLGNEVGKVDVPVGDVRMAVGAGGARTWLDCTGHSATEKAAVAAGSEASPSTASFELVAVLLG